MQVATYKIVSLELWSFAVSLFYRFYIELSAKKLELDLKRIKKRDQISYTHNIIMAIKNIYYYAVLIQEYKIKCREN